MAPSDPTSTQPSSLSPEVQRLLIEVRELQTVVLLSLGAVERQGVTNPAVAHHLERMAEAARRTQALLAPLLQPLPPPEGPG